MFQIQDIEAGIAQLTIDDGQGKNHLLQGDTSQLLELLDNVVTTPTRVLMVRGRQDVFSSGSSLEPRRT